VLRSRSADRKELEILVLRHELAMFRRRTSRPVIRRFDRIFVSAASRLLPRNRCHAFVITPATLLQWHRRLVANRRLSWSPPDSARHSTARGRSGSFARCPVLPQCRRPRRVASTGQ
jgi:hypothetical protein